MCSPKLKKSLLSAPSYCDETLRGTSPLMLKTTHTHTRRHIVHLSAWMQYTPLYAHLLFSDPAAVFVPGALKSGYLSLSCCSTPIVQITLCSSGINLTASS